MKRKCLEAAEVETMIAVAQTPIERLLMTLLVEVGLPNHALCKLRYDALLSSESYEARKECTAMGWRKGYVRFFMASPRLQEAARRCGNALRLSHALHGIDAVPELKDCYLLNPTNLFEPLPLAALNRMMRHVAKRAKVESNVSNRVFLHTLISRHLRSGNRPDIIGMFLGPWCPCGTALRRTTRDKSDDLSRDRFPLYYGEHARL